MTNTDKQQTCNERIAEHMASRIADVERLHGDISDEEREEIESELASGLLSVETEKTYKLLLSWGGPSDGYEITVDMDNNFLRGSYFFRDWFDSAERSLTEEDARSVCEAYGLWEVEF